MTPAEFTEFFRARHGQQWYAPASEETGYSFSHLWRIEHESRPVSRKLEKIVAGLKPLRKKKTGGNPASH